MEYLILFPSHDPRCFWTLYEFGRFLELSEEISEELSINSAKISEASQGFKIGYDSKIKELESQVSIMSKNNSDLKEQLNVLEKSKVKKGGWVLPASVGIVIGAFATLLVK